MTSSSVAAQLKTPGDGSIALQLKVARRDSTPERAIRAICWFNTLPGSTPEDV